MIAATSSGGSSFGLLILLVPIGLMFFMMRSQKRRTQQQRAVQHAAGVGDEVMTTSGIFGTIASEDEDEGTIMLEIAPGTQIKMVRAGIARRITEDQLGADDDDDADDDDENAKGPFRS